MACTLPDQTHRTSADHDVRSWALATRRWRSVARCRPGGHRPRAPQQSPDVRRWCRRPRARSARRNTLASTPSAQSAGDVAQRALLLRAAPPSLCAFADQAARARRRRRACSRRRAESLGRRSRRAGCAFRHHIRAVAQVRRVPYSPYDVDFRPQGPYAPYNWELFFHVPLLIASRLMQDARYEDARTWFHYIFDPTTSSDEDVPARFWKLQPFRDNDGHARRRAADDRARHRRAGRASPPSVNAQIDQWHRYPADPHRIARLRTVGVPEGDRLQVPRQPDRVGRLAVPRRTRSRRSTRRRSSTCSRASCSDPRPQHVPPERDVPVHYDDFEASSTRCRTWSPRSRRRCIRRASRALSSPKPVAHRCSASPPAGDVPEAGARRTLPHVPLISASRPTRSCSATGTRSPTGCSRSATA